MTVVLSIQAYSNMGGGNAQKSATARARNEAKKAKANKGSQLAVNKAAQSIVCQVQKSPCKRVQM